MGETVDIDAGLLLRIKQDDERAFKKLFDKYFTQLSIYADRMLVDTDAATDVVQSLFVSIYENRKELNIKNIKSFLYQSTHNRCLNILKHNKIKTQYEDMTMETGDESYTAIEEGIEAAELEARLVEALKQLPTQCRKIFEMSRLDGKTNSEIADELGLSKRTVETQISKALKILREILGDLMVVIGILFDLI